MPWRKSKKTQGPWLQSKWPFPPFEESPDRLCHSFSNEESDRWTLGASRARSMASAAAKRTTYSIEVNMREKALLSHSGRLPFSLPNSPNETSFTHLVDDPEDFNKAPFCLIPIPLQRGWSSGSLLLLLLGWSRAPESQKDSFPNHSCSLLPASQLGPISLSKSHLDEAPALLNYMQLSFQHSFFSTFLLYLPREPLFPYKALEGRPHFPHYVDLTPEPSHSPPLFHTVSRAFS